MANLSDCGEASIHFKTMAMTSRVLAGLVRALRPGGSLGHQGAWLSTSAPSSDTQDAYQSQEPIVLSTVDAVERWQHNTITVTGKVIASPNMRQDRAGRPLANLTVVKRGRRLAPGERTVDDLFNFMARGALAHAVLAQVRKGQLVIVTADVKQDTQNTGPEPQEEGPGFRRPAKSYVFFARDVQLVDLPQRQSTEQAFNQPGDAYTGQNQGQSQTF